MLYYIAFLIVINNISKRLLYKAKLKGQRYKYIL